jgi:hypothetical protein
MCVQHPHMHIPPPPPTTASHGAHCPGGTAHAPCGWLPARAAGRAPRAPAPARPWGWLLCAAGPLAAAPLCTCHRSGPAAGRSQHAPALRRLRSPGTGRPGLQSSRQSSARTGTRAGCACAPQLRPCGSTCVQEDITICCQCSKLHPALPCAAIHDSKQDSSDKSPRLRSSACPHSSQRARDRLVWWPRDRHNVCCSWQHMGWVDTVLRSQQLVKLQRKAQSTSAHGQGRVPCW